MKLTLTSRRLIAGAVVLVLSLPFVNSAFHLHLFGVSDRKLFAAALLIGLVWIVVLPPNIAELLEYRDRKRQAP